MKLQLFLQQKPPQMSVGDYKIGKAYERKLEVEDFNFKKSIFLLNKQEILKDYVILSQMTSVEKRSLHWS